jgi:hypothetical protein
MLNHISFNCSRITFNILDKLCTGNLARIPTKTCSLQTDKVLGLRKWGNNVVVSENQFNGVENVDIVIDTFQSPADQK